MWGGSEIITPLLSFHKKSRVRGMTHSELFFFFFKCTTLSVWSEWAFWDMVLRDKHSLMSRQAEGWWLCVRSCAVLISGTGSVQTDGQEGFMEVCTPPHAADTHTHTHTQTSIIMPSECHGSWRRSVDICLWWSIIHSIREGCKTLNLLQLCESD